MVCLECSAPVFNKKRQLCKRHYSKFIRHQHPYSTWSERMRTSTLRRNREWMARHGEYNTARMKKYRHTKKGKEAVLRAVKKYEAKHPRRKRAWGRAQWKKPVLRPCIVCGKLPTHRHHPNVNLPDEVIFLCPQHHKDVHNGKIYV